ncbi:hypothetical protein [Silanimonas sp.]|jgi:hypothetical protein|uniref:hypothetical protein n=1 Tax=Silanimonas sp. TaxID=1929290 RepID=UPI0022C8BBE7|nr:hypothetical protein [Silanimonas sp.]MCZ8113807.1 hypothetical protein [Silanimonas sp.]
MGLLDRFVGRLTRGQSAGPYALNEDDRKALAQNGLLQAGLSMLATPSNGMQGIARGLLAGVQGVQQGAGDLVNDRYRTDVMARTQSQMDANTARETAMRGVLNPDGTLNTEGWQRYAELDPIEAMRLRQQVDAANAPKPLTPRETRTLVDGGFSITQEWDGTTGQWQEIARAPRWLRGSGASGGGGTASPALTGTGGTSGAPQVTTAGGSAPQGGLSPRPGQPMTPEEVAAYGLPRGTAAMWDAKGAPKILRQPSADEIKQRTAASRMLPQLQAVRRGVDRIREATTKLGGNRFFGSGPLDQLVTARTPEGQELESAIGGIQNPMLALTRVPGVGAQSDLEARIANLRFPQIGKDEEVNKRDLAELEAFYTDLENAYRNVLGDEFPADEGAGGQGDGKTYSVGEIITLGNKRYRVIGGSPTDPDLEEIR